MSVDRRDPQALGEYLFYLRDEVAASYPPLSQLMDANMDLLSGVTDYDGGESMLTLTLQDRQTELETRAAEGDRFAAALLAGDSLAEEVVD